MEVSDSVETFINFFNASSGSDHHILAFGLSEKPGFQHAGFELAALMKLGWLASGCSKKATSIAGGRDGTALAQTTSNISAIRGTASQNISVIWIISPLILIGRLRHG